MGDLNVNANTNAASAPAPVPFLHENSVRMLLQDLQCRHETLWRIESSGETRVSLLTTLVTATFGGLGYLGTQPGVATQLGFWQLAIGAVLALLALGIMTLLRLIGRNAKTDAILRDIDAIRSRFRTADPLLQEYANHPRQPEHRKPGGLTQTVAVINGVLASAALAGGLAGYALTQTRRGFQGLDEWQILLLVLAFVQIVHLQWQYIAHAEAQSKARTPAQLNAGPAPPHPVPRTAPSPPAPPPAAAPAHAAPATASN